MTTSLFYGPQLKVKRAHTHICELKDKVATFCSKNPYQLVIERESTQYKWVVRAKEESPEDFPLIIGDAIHNLRSALDLLACDLVSLNNGNIKNVYFPFCKAGTELEDTIKHRHLDRAAQDLVDIIRSLKPYSGGNNLLRAIHDLDIADKHQMIIPSVASVEVTDLKLYRNNSMIASIQGMSLIGVKDGTIFMITPPIDNIPIGQEFNITFNIVFGRNQPLEYQPILPILDQLHELVLNIIEKFIKHLAI